MSTNLKKGIFYGFSDTFKKVTPKVIQYTKFWVCKIAWKGIESSDLPASSYTEIYR